VISKAETIEKLRGELSEAIQAMEHLAELLREVYTSDEILPETGEAIEETLKALNLDL
tara:strand:+ start:138 stop:311 length:174 start_codon:yes stop_codon:yes gene_type:complete